MERKEFKMAAAKKYTRVESAPEVESTPIVETKEKEKKPFYVDL